MCEYEGIPLKNDGWTPALKTIALEIMNEFLARPAVSVIINSQKKAGKDHRFYFRIKEKIDNLKYASISNWIDDLLLPLDIHSKDIFYAAVSEDLFLWIREKTSILLDLSRFKFKSSLDAVLQDLKKIDEMSVDEIQVDVDF